jgi:hypothetical protein
MAEIEWRRPVIPLYLARFRVKIKADQQLLEDPKVTCYEILETLPETKRTRVFQWFLNEGPHKDWNVDEFLLVAPIGTTIAY